MLWKLCILAAFASLAHGVQSDVDQWPSVEDDHTKFQVIVPKHLTVKGGYKHKDALFGYPSYTVGSLETQLIYADSTACEELKNDKWEPPFALMIDRGDCHFVEKVRRAQHAGASAVIISDNKCLCTDSDCMAKTGDITCEAVLPYMADDESGGDITIPSMMIRKSDGEAIKNEIKKHPEALSNVLVKFDWGIPSPDGRPEWTVWHSAWDEQSLTELKEIETIANTLKDRAFFTPHFVSYNGTRVGCHVTETGASNPCGNMCLNNGRYCLLDPSPFHDQEAGASGADVVLENLRRLCVWNVTSHEDPGVGKKWWRYVNTFGEECSQDEDHFRDPNCARRVMKQFNIDTAKVEECMKPYGPNVDEPNPRLEHELKEQTELQLLRLPALYVDGVHARGKINGGSMLGMICAGYGSHNPPEICDCVNQSPAGTMDCVKQGGFAAMQANQSSGGGVGFGTIFFVILAIAGSVGLVGAVHYHRTQQRMKEQVRSILAEYMPLEDQSEDSPRMMHPAAVASAMSPRGFMPSGNNFADDDDDRV